MLITFRHRQSGSMYTQQTVNTLVIHGKSTYIHTHKKSVSKVSQMLSVIAVKQHPWKMFLSNKMICISRVWTDVTFVELHSGQKTEK